MKLLLLPVFFLLAFSTVAQQSAYQSFEVDSAAIPRGGMPYLTTFIQANLRKPTHAEAKGVGGMVVVGGTVETNGRISNVNVMKSLQPDCDREAVRVFKLFNAWKPAQKGGKSVQQLVSIPIRFMPNTPFLYVNGAHITFFNSDRIAITDSTVAEYKQVAPLDSIGLPAGDIVLYEKKGKQWKETSRLAFVRKESESKKKPDQTTYTIGYPNGVMGFEGQFAVLNKAGSLVRRAYRQKGTRVGTEYAYHSNGSIAEQIEETNIQTNYTYWYPNGQIKQIKTKPKIESLKQVQPEQVAAYWDTTGNVLVKNGTGYVTYKKSVTSRADTTRRTLFVEQGQYENGLQQGIWTGRYADGSYFYEETYDKGLFQAGKAKVAKGDTLRYTEIEQMPEFPGGMRGLEQFLSQNLRYPTDAQRVGAQGRVFVSFTVCTDGTLCDYTVLKGVHPELDKEAVRVVEKMSGHWKPGVQRGEKVRVKYNVPIGFSLH